MQNKYWWEWKLYIHYGDILGLKNDNSIRNTKVHFECVEIARKYSPMTPLLDVTPFTFYAFTKFSAGKLEFLPALSPTELSMGVCLHRQIMFGSRLADWTEGPSRVRTAIQSQRAVDREVVIVGGRTATSALVEPLTHGAL